MGATQAGVSPIRWTEEQKAELRRLTVEERMGPQRAAAAMGLGPLQVKGARQRFGFRTGGNKGIRRKWTNAALRALSEELGPRVSHAAWDAVAERLGCKRDAVRMAVTRWRQEQESNTA